jgi:YkoY family integral membrane protein
MITTLIIILNLILLEIVLSIDNAAVLSTMVNDLPKEDQKKALTYGILGAYLFRGLALLFASFLINLGWLKLVGGLYLIYLAINSFRKSEDGKSHSQFKIPFLSKFWSTVVMIELMDIVFSIDNIFSAVAFTNNFLTICFGVFVGILAIRFATVKLISLLNSVPNLEKIAFGVIGLLGVKLSLSVFIPQLTNEWVDAGFSLITLLAFAFPFVLRKIKK